MGDLTSSNSFNKEDKPSINDIFINEGGYKWVKLMDYREFLVYKDRNIDYYQFRKLDGAYLFNCKALSKGKDTIDYYYKLLK